MGRKNTRPWGGRASGVLQPASDSRSASWLGPIPRQSRLFSCEGVCLWTSTCVRKPKRGRHDKNQQKKRKKIGSATASVGLSSGFVHTGEKLRSCGSGNFLVSPATARLHFGALFCSLNDGVPVEVVLDVVCRQHAPHLEVSQRQPVLLLLLLAQLAEVACHGRCRVAQGG